MEAHDRLKYETLQGQVQAIRAQAERVALQKNRVYAAYAQLAQNASFQIVLEAWIQAVMLQPIANDVDRGKHEFLRLVLLDLRNAVEGRYHVEGVR